MPQKKSFKDNPALRFISAAEPIDQHSPECEETAARPNLAAPHKPQPERKSKRLNLLVRPSTSDALAKIAYIKQTSVNDYINTVLQASIQLESDTLAQYDRIFSREEPNP